MPPSRATKEQMIDPASAPDRGRLYQALRDQSKAPRLA
jgi:hypothetical protein